MKTMKRNNCLMSLAACFLMLATNVAMADIIGRYHHSRHPRPWRNSFRLLLTIVKDSCKPLRPNPNKSKLPRPMAPKGEIPEEQIHLHVLQLNDEWRRKRHRFPSMTRLEWLKRRLLQIFGKKLLYKFFKER